MDDQRIDVSLLPTGQAVITLIGEFDLADDARLNEVSQFAFSLSPDAVVEASQITFLDSTVVAWLVRADRMAAARHGSFTLSNPSDRVRRVLKLTGLDDVLHIAPPVADANLSPIA